MTRGTGALLALSALWRNPLRRWLPHIRCPVAGRGHRRVSGVAAPWVKPKKT